jgi:hypothetical protein
MHYALDVMVMYRTATSTVRLILIHEWYLFNTHKTPYRIRTWILIVKADIDGYCVHDAWAE